MLRRHGQGAVRTVHGARDRAGVRLMSAANWKMCVGAITTCSVMLAAQIAPAFAQSAPTAPQTAAPPKQAAPAGKPLATKQPGVTSSVDADGGWPRAYMTSSGAAMLVYQPQVASWPDQKHMVLYLAVSYTPKGAEKPALGSVKAEAETQVAVAERLVSFTNLKVTGSNFSTLTPEQSRTAGEEIAREIPQPERVIALDRVLARLDKSQIMPKNVEGLKADPPVIFSSSTPAVLVNIDGDPIWSPIRENDLKFAVNTNWDLFQHTPSNTFYLRNDHSWLQASAVSGPWKAAGKLPGSFAKLPADDNWKEVKAALNAAKLADSQVPRVFVSTKPAELILV